MNTNTFSHFQPLSPLHADKEMYQTDLQMKREERERGERERGEKERERGGREGGGREVNHTSSNQTKELHSIPANECAAESSSVPLDLTATKLSEKGAWESLAETSSLRVVGKGAERMRERMAAVLDLRSVGSIWSESRRLFS